MENVSRPLPFAAFEWLLSGRYLRARRKEGFISVIAGFSFLGIMLGVATLIIVMAVMNGFRKELIDKIVGMNGHLVAQPLESPLTDWEDVAARIGQVPGVKLVVPVVDGPALASSAQKASGVLIRGIRADDLNKLASVASNIQSGSLEAFEKGQGVAIGRRLAEQLGLRADDPITLVAPGENLASKGIVPRMKPFRVAAVFSTDMSEYDSVMVFLPLAEAQAYFNRASDVSAIEIFLEARPDRVDDFRKPVADAAGRPVYLADWRRRTSAFFAALQVERNVMFLILTLIVLVAALNIVSGLIMLVKDKGSDIAILRTVGASRGSIMRVFLIAGAAIGVVGTLTGLLLGMLVCVNIESIRRFLSWVTNTELFPPKLYFLSKLPAEIDVGETAAVVAMALTLSFLATLYPSWRAARLDPVEAFRYG
jgi:lipoprotein-releasing system permease protein